ncbi:MAG: THUMP domain-containing protein [Candidatus Nitrosocaldus sp.]
MIDLLLTCPPGLEDVVELEAKEKLPDAHVSKRHMGVRGHVLLHLERDECIAKVLSMRSIHHVMRYIASFSIERSKDALNTIYRNILALDLNLDEGVRFRVTSERLGRHEFTSIDVQRIAGKAIVDRFSSKVDLEHYDVEVRVDVVGEQCIVGVALTRESLHKRGYRVFDHPAALKASIAYAMLRLAEPRAGNILVDPMCGSGTIPIEAALAMPTLNLELYGFDVNTIYIDGAKANAESAGVGRLIKFMCYDCRMLDRIVTPDRIVTNPPYGIRMEPSIGLRNLYMGFAKASYRAMVDGGRIVVITLKHGLMKSMLTSSGFNIIKSIPVMHGDLWTHIIVGEKR